MLGGITLSHWRMKALEMNSREEQTLDTEHQKTIVNVDDDECSMTEKSVEIPESEFPIYSSSSSSSLQPVPVSFLQQPTIPVSYINQTTIPGSYSQPPTIPISHPMNQTNIFNSVQPDASFSFKRFASSENQQSSLNSFNNKQEVVNQQGRQLFFLDIEESEFLQRFRLADKSTQDIVKIILSRNNN